MVSLQRIRDVDGWVKLAAPWGALCDRVEAATPFQRPEWMLPWWRNWGSGDLQVLAFWRGARLCGMLPMFLVEWECRNQLTLVGNGISDYLGLVADSDEAAECAALAMRHVSQDADHWDVCDWQDLDATSPLIGAAPRSLACRVEDSASCMRAPVDAAAAAYVERNIRTARRQLEKLGSVEFETLHRVDGRMVEELVTLHQSRWAKQGGPASLLDLPRSIHHLQDTAEAFGRSGRLRVYVMRVDGRLSAGIFGFLDHGTVFGYFTGFAAELARYSPGSVLLRYAHEDAAAEGAKTWDFLRGTEAYKRDWGAVEVPKRRLKLQTALEGSRKSREYATEVV